jgi:glyoxylase-like metal-dependent hydrolase (beta-lactamase superfamily II)
MCPLFPFLSATAIAAATSTSTASSTVTKASNVTKASTVTTTATTTVATTATATSTPSTTPSATPTAILSSARTVVLNTLLTALLTAVCTLWLATATIVHADANANAETNTNANVDRPIAAILEPIALTDRVYYFYGSIEARTPLNLGMNNNIGFVVTDAGVVLIDSGPSQHVAAKITAAVATVTDQPITHVINLGSQDHRWLGNGWFLANGAEIIALQRTAETQQRFAATHVQRLTQALGEEVMAGTEPVTAPVPIAADRHAFTIGGVAFELFFVADAHFPGDSMLYLPDEQLVFTGDVVYTERLLGIHPQSNPVGKLESFRQLATLNPTIIVPGHGAATDLATARRDTGDYLEFVLHEVRAGIDDWEMLDATVERIQELPQFQHLRHYDEWHRINVNRIYLFLESAP